MHAKNLMESKNQSNIDQNKRRFLNGIEISTYRILIVFPFLLSEFRGLSTAKRKTYPLRKTNSKPRRQSNKNSTRNQMEIILTTADVDKGLHFLRMKIKIIQTEVYKAEILLRVFPVLVFLGCSYSSYFNGKPRLTEGHI